METNLAGRLRNTPLPLASGLFPLYEAVANSIHAIEEAGHESKLGEITVEIVRDTQGSLDLETDRKKRGPEAKNEITGFKITDNGIGFTDVNMTSFRTLDTDHKASQGGRGVGRLLWLKAFRRARITSVCMGAGGRHKRTFIFALPEGVSKEQTHPTNQDQLSTSVELEDFEERYREATPKTIKGIANALFEHCLWYFVRESGAPHIVVIDGEEKIDLQEVFQDHLLNKGVKESVQLKGSEFSLMHIRIQASAQRSHTVALCASNRLVVEENIKGKIPGLFGTLTDDTGHFTYHCYVTSKFLDEHVRAERTSFDIEEKSTSLFASTDISLEDIRDVVLARAAEHLRSFLEANRRMSKDRVETFVSRKAPRYRSILNRIPEAELSVDPNISDKELELVLHKQLAEVEGTLLAEGHDLLVPLATEDKVDYQKRLQNYLKTAEDIKKSDLANYVSHRRIIIDLLEMAIQRKSDGTYAREDLIHSLIMPLGVTSDEVSLDSCNLWLLDERLAFHDFLASDKTISSMPIGSAQSKKEPDLLALNVFDNPVLVSEGDKLPLASIVVVEFKRPMRDDARSSEDKDPIEQALGYLERIRSGQVTTKAGRPIPRSENIPGFCYVICDITPSMERRCKMHDAIRTSDGLGYFFYQKNFSAFVEIVSFDRLVNAAKERNRAFFDKLGLPTI